MNEMKPRGEMGLSPEEAAFMAKGEAMTPEGTKAAMDTQVEKEFFDGETLESMRLNEHADAETVQDLNAQDKKFMAEGDAMNSADIGAAMEVQDAKDAATQLANEVDEFEPEEKAFFAGEKAKEDAAADGEGKMAA